MISGYEGGFRGKVAFLSSFGRRKEEFGKGQGWWGRRKIRPAGSVGGG